MTARIAANVALGASHRLSTHALRALPAQSLASAAVRNTNQQLAKNWYGFSALSSLLHRPAKEVSPLQADRVSPQPSVSSSDIFFKAVSPKSKPGSLFEALASNCLPDFSEEYQNIYQGNPTPVPSMDLPLGVDTALRNMGLYPALFVSPVSQALMINPEVAIAEQRQAASVATPAKEEPSAAVLSQDAAPSAVSAQESSSIDEKPASFNRPSPLKIEDCDVDSPDSPASGASSPASRASSPRSPASGASTPRSPASGTSTPRSPVSGASTPRSPMSASSSEPSSLTAEQAESPRPSIASPSVVQEDFSDTLSALFGSPVQVAFAKQASPKMALAKQDSPQIEASPVKVAKAPVLRPSKRFKEMLRIEQRQLASKARAELLAVEMEKLHKLSKKGREEMVEQGPAPLKPSDQIDFSQDRGPLFAKAVIKEENGVTAPYIPTSDLPKRYSEIMARYKKNSWWYMTQVRKLNA